MELSRFISEVRTFSKMLKGVHYKIFQNGARTYFMIIAVDLENKNSPVLGWAVRRRPFKESLKDMCLDFIGSVLRIKIKNLSYILISVSA